MNLDLLNFSSGESLVLPSRKLEPGSFRDRNARVFYADGKIFRALNVESAENFKALCTTNFYVQASKAGQIIATEESADISMPAEIASEGWAAIILHEKIAFVSYPYEWSFGMLKDAALLHLDLLERALKERFIIKDSSAYNIQWTGTQPVFIDVPSFEKYEEGDLWAGYRQFCQMFLYPLMLQSYKGVSFQSIMRGNIDGINVEDMNAFMSARDLLRTGVFKHVYLQSKLQAGHAASARNVRQELKDLGFHRELILANVKGLKKLVKKLNLRKSSSEWTDYASNNSYESSDMQIKKEFVTEAVAERKRALVWDIGSNTGTFSKIAAQNGAYVLAIDADPLAVERMYQDLKQTGNSKILPLVMNLANPSPNQGWRGAERKGLAERGQPDLVLALALIHHAVISANIPVWEFVSWLASFQSDLVVEFVSKEDIMVKTLLANKIDNYSDYEIGNFEKCLGEHYKIIRKRKLDSGTRTLYYCKPLAT